MRCSSGLAGVVVASAAAVSMAPVGAQSAATGSDVPCAVPMTWTIGRIDPRFDLSEEWALQAAREAGSLWERAVGVKLFRFGPEAAYPIHFDFDERQAGVEARRERERALDVESTSIEEARAELEEASREYDVMLERYERDMAEHSRAVRAYNNDLERVSRQRDVPRPVQRELERRGEELDRSSRDLRNRQRELSRLSDSMRRDVDRFNERIAQLSARQSELSSDFPPVATQSGSYDETVTREDATPVSVTRRIRVFQFASYEDLVLVLAHELGHALGLGHAPRNGAVMSETIMSGTGDVRTVTEIDLRMLTARCPQVVGVVG